MNHVRTWCKKFMLQLSAEERAATEVQLHACH